jgi:CDP-2,3-bis-(O-geranylgeranyl)-sn-glycerol synthase
MNDIFTLLWLFLPVGLANMAPVIANNIQLLKRYTQPLDFEKTFRGKRIFGEHKTFRGVFAGVLLGGLVAFLQMIISALFDWPGSLSFGLDYSSFTIVFMGMAMGFGAVAGDAIESFFKRQIGIAPGRSWAPFDQIDFVLGGLLASLPFFVLPLRMYVVGLFLALILHPTINVLAWLLRLQDKPF